MTMKKKTQKNGKQCENRVNIFNKLDRNNKKYEKRRHSRQRMHICTALVNIFRLLEHRITMEKPKCCRSIFKSKALRDFNLNEWEMATGIRIHLSEMNMSKWLFFFFFCFILVLFAWIQNEFFHQKWQFLLECIPFVSLIKASSVHFCSLSLKNIKKTILFFN